MLTEWEKLSWWWTFASKFWQEFLIRVHRLCWDFEFRGTNIAIFGMEKIIFFNFYIILFWKTVSRFYYFIMKFFYFDIALETKLFYLYFNLVGNYFILILFYVTSLWDFFYFIFLGNSFILLSVWWSLVISL